MMRLNQATPKSRRWIPRPLAIPVSDLTPVAPRTKLLEILTSTPNLAICEPVSIRISSFRSLERQPHAELQTPIHVHFYRLVTLSGGHLAEGRILHVRVRAVKPRRVAQIKRGSIELQVHPLREAKLANHRRVDIEQPGSTQDIAANVAKGIRRRVGERRGGKPILARSHVARDLNRR